MRRSATRAADGVTFMVHEALSCDVDAQIQHVLNRHEVWDADGELVTTFIRRHRLRWWTADQLEATAAGERRREGARARHRRRVHCCRDRAVPCSRYRGSRHMSQSGGPSSGICSQPVTAKPWPS